MKGSICRITAICALFLAQHSFAQDMSALAFLSGHWQEKTERSDTQESWLGPRGDLMVATNLSLRGGRAGFEYLRIAKRDGKLIYMASPGGKQPATEFALKEVQGTRAVFENPTHDFPQRIIYRREGETLVARIEGKINGQDKAMEWNFKRVTEAQ